MEREITPPNARVTERQDLNEALIVFRAVYDDEHTPSYIAGQFVNLGLEPRSPDLASGKSNLVKRPYSVSSVPGEASVEFFVRLVDEGALTPELFRCGVGDPLWMDERFLGKFTLEMLPESPAPADRDVVMVSTGTGLAPFMSMLRANLAARPWRRLVMINGVRIESDLGYREELESLDREQDWFTYLPVLSRPEPDGNWAGLTGHVGALLKPDTYQQHVGVPLEPQTGQVMLCGNPAMIDEVQADLESRGFEKHSRRNPGQIHLERYW